MIVSPRAMRLFAGCNGVGELISARDEALRRAALDARTGRALGGRRRKPASKAGDGWWAVDTEPRGVLQVAWQPKTPIGHVMAQG